jgi:hypothetical protein
MTFNSAKLFVDGSTQQEMTLQLTYFLDTHYFVYLVSIPTRTTSLSRDISQLRRVTCHSPPLTESTLKWHFNNGEKSKLGWKVVIKLFLLLTVYNSNVFHHGAVEIDHKKIRGKASELWRRWTSILLLKIGFFQAVWPFLGIFPAFFWVGKSSSSPPVNAGARSGLNFLPSLSGTSKALNLFAPVLQVVIRFSWS